jgi:hypothetical protein
MRPDPDLTARYRTWSAEELHRAVATEASEYTPEALEAIRLELENRGLAPMAVQQGEEPFGEAGASDDAPKGIGGWLLVFIIVLAIRSLRDFSFCRVALDPRFDPFDRMIAGLSTCLGGYGLVCCLLLLAKHRNAPRLAAVYPYCLALLSIVLSVSRLMAHRSPTGPGISLVGCGLWLTYLSRSRRVRATYGSNPTSPWLSPPHAGLIR